MHSAHQYRHFYLLIGSAEQRVRAFHALTQALASPFITTLAPADFSAAALAAELALPCQGFNSLDLQLGHTSEAILFDLQQGLSANSLAIAAGTVCGGGLLALGLDDLALWQDTPDGDLARHLPWPLTPEQQLSPFKRYFAQHLQTEALKVIDLSLSADLRPLPKILGSAAAKMQFTPQQQALISDIVGFFSREILPNTNRSSPTTKALSSSVMKVLTLIAHRGRGKSSVLGVALAQLLQAGLKVRVTAPRRSAVNTLAYHFALTAAVDTKTLPFCAPDELLQQPLPLDLLIVDEAAALPLPMLEQLSQHYPNILFSSTDHGYEGGGKGFGIRFIASLKRPDVTLQQHTLETPVRWRAGDPLEHWLDTLLLLYPAKHATSITSQQTYAVSSQPPFQALPLQAIKGIDWLSQPSLLQQSFSLLVSAHYQTSPDDLRWIIDDPSVTSWIYRAKEQLPANHNQQSIAETKLSAIAVVTQEGPIEPAMALEVLAGRRRPRGHLLPQSLLAHEGWLEAAEYRFWRISRIATAIEQQRQGHASALLKQLEEAAKAQQVDFLCCSFAATLEVVQFWQKNGFHAVRLGTSRDQASGRYSLMMLKALNTQAHSQAHHWQQAYSDNLLLKLLLGYADLPTALVLALCRQSQPQPPLAKDLADLELFVHQHRPYSSIQAQLTRCCFAFAQQGKFQPQHLSHLRLFQAALGQINEKQHPYASRRTFLNDIKASLQPLLKP